ncbi:MAG: hypothetical protein VYC32_05280, partial [Planctomycetota bacterium]|nr:hypothetical protein [Planctomycetota bacterium]
MFAGEERAGTTEAGKDLVGDQDRPVTIAEIPNLDPAGLRPHYHSPAPLLFRFDYNGRDLVS